MDKVAIEGLNFVGNRWELVDDLDLRLPIPRHGGTGDQVMEMLLCIDDDAAELRGTTVRLPTNWLVGRMRRVRLSRRHMRISPGQLQTDETSATMRSDR